MHANNNNYCRDDADVDGIDIRNIRNIHHVRNVNGEHYFDDS